MAWRSDSSHCWLRALFLGERHTAFSDSSESGDPETLNQSPPSGHQVTTQQPPIAQDSASGCCATEFVCYLSQRNIPG